MGFKFPRRFGARDDTLDIEHQALLEALRPGFDVSEGTELWDETRVEALALAIIWSVNRRVGNQNNPLKMLENLPKWESACTLRPAVGDTDRARRERLAAKLRGLSGNALQDIAEAAEQALGVHFDAFLEVDPADWITYWPGLNPGPPGYEWASNRATVGIRMTTQGLTDSELVIKRNWLIKIIGDMVPAWMTFVVGVGDEFVCSVGLVGQTVVA
jgi:hypothetical protein